MRRLGPRDYIIVLSALLHDVGKPLQRALAEAEREKRGAELREKLGPILGNLVREASVDHIVASRAVLHWLGVKEEPPEFHELLKQVDPWSALERGVQLGDREFQEFAENLKRLKPEEFLRDKLGLDQPFSPQSAPLLSPTWIPLQTGYPESLGLRAIVENLCVDRGEREPWSAASVYEDVKRRLSWRGVNAREFLERVAELLGKLRDEPVWFPVKPLDPEFLVELRGMKLDEAMRKSRYEDVALRLGVLLEGVREIYKVDDTSLIINDGLIGTLEYVLKSTTLFVPSAVFAALVPDISLYAHSKLVAAYAAALLASDTRSFRILSVDANGIQGFVGAPVKAAAASRVLRGRSLLANLALDSIAQYALELFGNLPQANIIAEEGGTLDIIVPDTRDFDKRLSELRRVTESLSVYELSGSLRFTVEASDPIPLQRVNISPYDVMEAFHEARRRLFERLNLTKRHVDIGVEAESSEYEVDALTYEPLLIPGRKPGTQWLGECNLVYRYTAEDERYNEVIAGGKLSEGDVLAPATHLSLIAGSVARNLIAVVALHAYRVENDTVKPLEPSALCKLMESLCERIAKRIGVTMRHKLMCKIRISLNKHVEEFDIGFIPLPSTGALYILVSAPKSTLARTQDYAELLSTSWLELLVTILKNVKAELAVFAKRLADDNAHIKVRLRILTINNTLFFVPYSRVFELIGKKVDVAEALTKSTADLLKALYKLGERSPLEVSVSFGYLFAGTIHPLDDKEKSEVPRLLDLDKLSLVAVAKLDVDRAGEVFSLLSYWPSRFVTLSEIQNIVLMAKTYLRLLMFNSGEEYSIPLYAGGDDAVFYGGWRSVLRTLIRVYRDVRSSLYPLSISAGYVFDRSHVPILELYGKVAELMEEVAKPVGGVAAVLGAQPRLVCSECRDGKERCTRVDAVPVLVERGLAERVSCRGVVYWSLELLEGVEKVEKGGGVLEAQRRALHILAELAERAQRLAEASLKPLEMSERSMEEEVEAERFRLALAYIYNWLRSEEARAAKLTVVASVLNRALACVLHGDCGDDESGGSVGDKLLPGYPDDFKSEKDLRCLIDTLAAAKPILDLLVLTQRVSELKDEEEKG